MSYAVPLAGSATDALSTSPNDSSQPSHSLSSLSEHAARDPATEYFMLDSGHFISRVPIFVQYIRKSLDETLIRRQRRQATPLVM